jgi:hypothetical protein
MLTLEDNFAGWGVPMRERFGTVNGKPVDACSGGM